MFRSKQQIKSKIKFKLMKTLLCNIVHNTVTTRLCHQKRTRACEVTANRDWFYSIDIYIVGGKIIQLITRSIWLANLGWDGKGMTQHGDKLYVWLLSQIISFSFIVDMSTSVHGHVLKRNCFFITLLYIYIYIYPLWNFNEISIPTCIEL